MFLVNMCVYEREKVGEVVVKIEKKGK